MTIDASDYIRQKKSNPEYNMYCENISKTAWAVNGVMDDANNDIYISISPDTMWSGGQYVNYSNLEIKDVTDVLLNIAAFGTFNDTNAGITAHCTYDSTKKEITMHYKYYLIDFYDYSWLDDLQQQDVVGLARSFELYGVKEGEITWKKLKRTEGDNILDVG